MNNKNFTGLNLIYRIRPFTELEDNPVFLKQIKQKYFGMNFICGKVFLNVLIFCVLFFSIYYLLEGDIFLSQFSMLLVYILTLLVKKSIKILFRPGQLGTVEHLASHINHKKLSGELDALKLTKLNGRDIIWGLSAALLIAEYLSMLGYYIVFIISNIISVIIYDDMRDGMYFLLIFITYSSPLLYIYPAFFCFSLNKQLCLKNSTIFNTLLNEFLLFFQNLAFFMVINFIGAFFMVIPIAIFISLLENYSLDPNKVLIYFMILYSTIYLVTGAWILIRITRSILYNTLNELDANFIKNYS